MDNDIKLRRKKVDILSKEVNAKNKLESKPKTFCPEIGLLFGGTL